MFAELKAIFADQGFVVVRDLVDPKLLDRLTTDLIEVREAVFADPEAYDTRYTRRSTSDSDTWGVNHIFDPRLCRDGFGRLFEETSVVAIAEAILGGPLRFWGGHALWAPRSVDYSLNWHRDFGEHDVHIASGIGHHVQFNVCLRDDDSFRVVPGSHRRALTDEEAEAVRRKGTGPLPDEAVVRCSRGEVLFMNAHALHRGACTAGSERLTLHLSVQSAHAETGGLTSHAFMREPGYLERQRPIVRELMTRLVQWDDAHPRSLSERLRRARISRDIKRHQATD
jgi:ectoine hydroxylase-related dioxygenase (phytanoyl-CoA dioxygenase family)